ncbi:GntR family transcriptional regulator [Blautia sp. XA-2221]|uniref:GntR family transcriptional regulator n=1 Tax=Blautia sp. XA-2221 TaxID=2903961 RepID=UPI002ED57078
MTEKFRMLIYREALPAGSRLPSVRQLAMELSINPNTIQRAYTELEQEGLIYPVKGKGNFVAESDQILKIKKEDYHKEFMQTVRKGKNLGVQMEEMVQAINVCYEEEDQ